MSDRVCIVSVGARTCVGADAPSTAAAVRAGIANFAEHSLLVDDDGEPLIIAAAPYLDEETPGRERLRDLAVSAASDALTMESAERHNALEIPTVIGCPAERPGMSAHLESEIPQWFSVLEVPGIRVSDVEVIRNGHSAGMMALERGREWIAGGQVEFCLVGGVDSYIEIDTLEWLEEREQIHGARQNAWGFVPGEAAGFCLLALYEAARRHGLAPLAEVVAVASARETTTNEADSVNVGRGLTEAFRKVLAASPESATIDDIICDMNGEPQRSDEFGFTLARTSDRFADGCDFLTPADCWGDVGAASGPLFAVLAIAAWKKDYARGPLTLLWTSSESGERSAAVLSSVTAAH